MNNTILDYYRQFSQYTAPGAYKEILQKTLPDDVGDIGLLVRKSLIHRMTLKNGNTGSNSDLRYGDMTEVPWYRQPEDDIFPTAVAMLGELYRRDGRGLTLDRKTDAKLILTCRFTSILMACLLKTKGIPARVRSGFAPYFQVEGLPGSTSDDHWINQYWSEKDKKWITIDVDGSIEGYLKFDPYNIPMGVFDYSADAWLDVRNKRVPEEHFFNAGGYGGLVAIAWELFYDFHCLMNSEIVYYHHPEIATMKNFKKINGKQLEEIDHLAKLMQKPDDNFEELRRLWESKKEFRNLKGGLL